MSLGPYDSAMRQFRDTVQQMGRCAASTLSASWPGAREGMLDAALPLLILLLGLWSFQMLIEGLGKDFISTYPVWAIGDPVNKKSLLYTQLVFGIFFLF
jgi:hypothetical protein